MAEDGDDGGLTEEQIESVVSSIIDAKIPDWVTDVGSIGDLGKSLLNNPRRTILGVVVGWVAVQIEQAWTAVLQGWLATIESIEWLFVSTSELAANAGQAYFRPSIRRLELLQSGMTSALQGAGLGAPPAATLSWALIILVALYTTHLTIEVGTAAGEEIPVVGIAFGVVGEVYSEALAFGQRLLGGGGGE